MSDNSLTKQGYSNEDAYIKEKEIALRTERDKLRAVQEQEQEQELHWMRCPKCGGQMEEKDMETMKIDICNSCEGMYFDKGEFEIASKSLESHTVFDKVASFLKW
jgi:acetyl-CoA carboxylase beta subunit